MWCCNSQEEKNSPAVLPLSLFHTTKWCQYDAIEIYSRKITEVKIRKEKIKEEHQWHEWNAIRLFYFETEKSKEQWLIRVYYSARVIFPLTRTVLSSSMPNRHGIRFENILSHLLFMAIVSRARAWRDTRWRYQLFSYRTAINVTGSKHVIVRQRN